MNSSNNKIAPFVFAFLAFCVISSKHIIIYNEEILVALSFLFFVVFVSGYFGDTIKDSLDEITINIESELKNFLNVKSQCLHVLERIHEKASALPTLIENFDTFTKENTKEKIKASRKQLKNIVAEHTQLKLKNLSFATSNHFISNISRFLLSNLIIEKAKTRKNQASTSKKSLKQKHEYTKRVFNSIFKN